MDAATIGAIFSGVIGLVTAAGGIALTRQKNRIDNVIGLEAEVSKLRSQVESALRHIWSLRVELSRHGLTPPDLPDDLSPERNRRAERGGT